MPDEMPGEKKREKYPWEKDDDDDDHISITESSYREVTAMGLGADIFGGGEGKIEVVPDIEAREMTVICMVGKGGRYFKDDVQGRCDRCGIEVFHRPHVPTSAILVCTFCYQKEAAEKGKPDIFEQLRQASRKKKP